MSDISVVFRGQTYTALPQLAGAMGRYWVDGKDFLLGGGLREAVKGADRSLTAACVWAEREARNRPDLGNVIFLGWLYRHGRAPGLFWQGQSGTILCSVQWALIIAGVTFVAIFGPGRPNALHPVLFVVLGWCGLVFLPRMVRENLPLFLTTLAGGLTYTVGVIPFALKKSGAHFLWHFFVFFGAVVHWIGIYLFLY